MKIPVHYFLFGLIIALWSLPTPAEDVITIRYLGPYPPPNRSFETMNLRVTRHPPAIKDEAAKQDVDRYFEQISRVLAAHGVTRDWQLAIPDAPSIEITIDLQGRKITLISCHVSLERSGDYLVTERGGRAVSTAERARLLAGQSETFLQHRLAFEKILRLTLENTHARISP